jgi:acyl-coenzyme A synthetase/AMP-(fatty) acid ligase
MTCATGEDDFASRVTVVPAFLDRVELLLRAGDLDQIVLVDQESTEVALGWDDFRRSGSPDFDLAAAASAVSPDDVLCLIYTSGSTGDPRVSS